MNNINIGKKEIIHFIGIGGIGMSGLAQIMKIMKFTIQGSDLYRNKNIKVLFGAGGNRDKSKRVEMAKAIELFAVQCYVAPDNPRYENIDDINDDIIKGFSKHIYQVFSDRENGLKTALTELCFDDILIIFGKGNEEYQEIDGKKIYYSDRKIIENFYAN